MPTLITKESTYENWFKNSKLVLNTKVAITYAFYIQMFLRYENG